MTSLSSSVRHLRHLRLLSTTAATPLTISAANSRLRSEYDPDKALEIYSSVTDHNSSPIASRYAQDLTIRRLSKARRFSDIENLLESQKKSPKITEETFLSTLIRSYGRAGMFDHALQTFNQMEELGTPRSSVSFNALLSSCNYSKKFDKVPKLFAELQQKYKIIPDKFSYGILVKSLCESGLPESADLTMKEMEEKGVEITAVTYTTILDALYKKGKVDEAEKIWKEMVSKDIKPDNTAYNVRIMHAQEGKPEDVLALFDEMTSVGLKPDTVSYNYLMTCYCRNGMLDDAEKVYKGVEEKGLAPNATTFRTLVYYLCKAGEFDKGLKVFKESVEKEKIPSYGTLRILVEGLVKNGKVNEGKGVIKIVKRKFPNNILNAWKKLEVELGLSKETEAAAA